MNTSLPLTLRRTMMTALLATSLVGRAADTVPDPIVEAPQYVAAPEPVYPTASLRVGEEGRCVLRIQVLQDGSVREVRVHQSSGYRRLDEAAVESIGRTRFVAAKTARGRAVEAWVQVPLVFRLE